MLKSVEVIQKRYQVDVYPPDSAVEELDIGLPSQVSIVLVGTQGPPGASGAGFIHTQASASAEWVINHNLGFKPAIGVFDNGSREVDAEVVHMSDNQTKVYFSSATAGFARCV